MNESENPNYSNRRLNQKSTKPLFSRTNMIVIYTAFCVLARMRQTLGLEAMLEYIEKYRGAIEQCNPKMKAAVTRALTLINVEKVYNDVL